MMGVQYLTNQIVIGLGVGKNKMNTLNAMNAIRISLDIIKQKIDKKS